VVVFPDEDVSPVKGLPQNILGPHPLVHLVPERALFDEKLRGGAHQVDDGRGENDAVHRRDYGPYLDKVDRDLTPPEEAQEYAARSRDNLGKQYGEQDKLPILDAQEEGDDPFAEAFVG
jgi:hypothetical protein